MKESCSPLQLAELLTEYWSPRVIGEVGDYYVKVAKLKGGFGWHRHDVEDELFMVLKGSLVIELEHREVALFAGELFIVPMGTLHNPKADEDCLIMLFEPRSTPHGGSTEMKHTRTITEQLRPIPD